MKKAIVLCSGGLDSVTAAHFVRKKLYYSNILLLFFNYGQRSLASERRAVRFCANSLNASFLEVKIKSLKDISNSLLTSNKKINKLHRRNLKNTKKESQTFYVPCRNILFLTYALAIGESNAKKNDAVTLFTGFKHEGKEFFPDTSQAFVKTFNAMSKISTNNKIEVKAPLIKKDKEDIIKLALELGVNLEKTFSCYDGLKNHCGKCLACMLRKEGFYWANVVDTTKYEFNH